MDSIVENPRAVIGAEEWKAVPGHELYMVSSIGQVLGPKGSILRLQRRYGYEFFCVANGRNSSAKVSVARSVCAAFNGGNGAGLDCDHINRIRDDNRPENLRWVSRAENLLNRVTRRGGGHHASKLSDKSVREIRSGPHYRGFDADIAKKLGVSRETVRDARLGKMWRHVDA